MGPSVRLRAVYGHEVCWSLVRTGLPLVRHLLVENLGPDEARLAIALEVTVDGRTIADTTDEVVWLAPGSVRVLDARLEWRYRLAFAFRETTAGRLRISVRWEPGARHHAELPLRVLAGNEWCAGFDCHGDRFVERIRGPCSEAAFSLPSDGLPGPDDHPGPWPELHRAAALSLASLILPGHPDVRRLLADVFRTLRRADPRFQPVAFRSSVEGRVQLARHVFVGLHHGRDWFHAVAPVGFSRWTQKVRLPDDVLRGDGAANCIDRVLVYCAAAACAGLDPVAVVIPAGDDLHALGGIWLQPPARTDAFDPLLSMGELERAVHDGRLLLIELTAEGRGGDFQLAIDAADRRLAAAPATGGGYGVDVRGAWAGGAEPLPWHRDPLLVVAGFPEAYPARCEELLARLRIPAGLSREGLPGAATYVPLPWRRPRADGAGGDDLLEALTRRMANGGRRFAVLGNPGTGKTHLLGRLLSRAAAAFARAPDSRPIPVLVPLGRLDTETPRLLETIRGELVRLGYPSRETLESFEKKAEAGHVLFLLDGLDEVSFQDGPELEDYLRLLDEVLRLERATVVLSARSALFAARATELLGGFEVFELAEWGEDGWSAYFARCAELDHLSESEHRLLVDRLHRLPAPEALASKPLYCQLIVATKDWFTAADAPDEAKLLTRFVQMYLRRTIAGDEGTPGEKVRAMQHVALAMERKGLKVLRTRELADELSRRFPDAGNRARWRAYLAAARVYSFLHNELSEDFFFSHETFRELFLATLLVRQLLAEDVFGYLEPPAEPSSWRDFGSLRLSSEVARLMALLSPPGAEPLLREVFSWDRRHLGLWRGADPAKALRNFVLLQLALRGGFADVEPKPDLHGLDFSDPGLDLRRCDFAGCDLSSARFVGGDLTGANLHGCDLTWADFSHARLVEADLGGAKLDGVLLEGARLSRVRGLAPEPLALAERQKVVRCFEAELNGEEAAGEPETAAWLERHLELFRRV